MVSKHLNQPRIYVSTQGSYRNDKCCTPRRWTWLRRRGGTVCSRAAAFGNRSRVRIRVSRSDAHARTSRTSTNVPPREHRGSSVGTAWDCWALARRREPFCTCARPHLAIRTGHNRCSTPHLPLWTPLRRAQRLLHHYPNSQAWGHCLRGPLFCTFSLTRIHKALTLGLSRELIRD